MGVPMLMEGSRKASVYGEDCLKKQGRLGQFADLGEDLAKERRIMFLRGMIPQCTLCIMKANKLKS